MCEVSRLFESTDGMRMTRRSMEESGFFQSYSVVPYVNGDRTYLNLIASSDRGADTVKTIFADAYSVVDGEKVAS